MKFRYILIGLNYKALPIISDMNIMEIEDYINKNSYIVSNPIRTKIFHWGTIEFLEPQIMMVDDFFNNGPAIF